MSLLDVHVGQLAISPGHLETGVPQYFLQAENVTPIPQEVNSKGMSQSVRGTSNAGKPSHSAIALHYAFYTVFG